MASEIKRLSIGFIGLLALLGILFVVSGCTGATEDTFIASEQPAADEREKACMIKAAQTLNEISYNDIASGLPAENALLTEDDTDSLISESEQETSTPPSTLESEEQQQAYLEAHGALFETVREINFSVDTDTHLVMITSTLEETDPIKARDLGNSYARLFDYYANYYLEATKDFKDDSAAYNAELENCEVSFVEAYEAIGAYKDGDIGKIYDTYDFTSELDNLEHTLDVSGFKPAGTHGQLTWQ